MNIDDLTIKQARELAALFCSKELPTPYPTSAIEYQQIKAAKRQQNKPRQLSNKWGNIEHLAMPLWRLQKNLNKRSV